MLTVEGRELEPLFNIPQRSWYNRKIQNDFQTLGLMTVLVIDLEVVNQHVYYLIFSYGKRKSK